MKPLFTIHAGEFVAGDHIERTYRGVNVWVPMNTLRRKVHGQKGIVRGYRLKVGHPGGKLWELIGGIS